MRKEGISSLQLLKRNHEDFINNHELEVNFSGRGFRAVGVLPDMVISVAPPLTAEEVERTLPPATIA